MVMKRNTVRRNQCPIVRPVINICCNSMNIFPLPEISIPPSISGQNIPGSILTTTNGTWTNTPIYSYTYQWRRNGTNIIGATSSTYTTVSLDIGKAITCQVSVTNTGGLVSALSNTINCIDVIPSCTTQPVISGLLNIGAVLTVTAGVWTGTPTITYQWCRNGVNISGATLATYIALLADIGATITCKVTGTNASGSTTVTVNR